MSHTVDRRIILYPHYLDSTKTVAEGRRIPKPLGCLSPHVIEMADCCKQLNMPFEVEDKHYPRDWFIRGRLRVELKNGDGAFNNTEITNRRTLMLKVAELVAKHPGRKNGQPPILQGAPVAMPAPPMAASSGSSGKTSGSTKSAKKKGKK